MLILRLFEAVHSFVNTVINISILRNFGSNIILCVNVLKKYLECNLMYSGSSIGVARKKSFKSVAKNLAPLSASEIVLLRSNFASNSVAAGEPASCAYGNQSPPTVRRTHMGSDFKGRKSRTMLAYITFLVHGTSFL